ncbi:MAG TPA: hypothetical protein EYP40_05775, partial [Chromatiales bacterium]|nr:hypothetical protein [Chromatiales bacterium]
MSDPAPFYIEYHPGSAWENLQQANNLLAVVHFGPEHRVGDRHPAEIQPGLPGLGGDDWLEVWRSTEPLHSGACQQVRYRHNDTCIFGSLLIEESGVEDLALVTEAAYQQIHAVLTTTGFPALLRMWNFFPRINDESRGLERYRSFCMGDRK